MNTTAYKQHLQHCDCNRVMKQHYANVTRLEAQVERLEKDARQNSELCKAEIAGLREEHDALLAQVERLGARLRELEAEHATCPKG